MSAVFADSAEVTSALDQVNMQFPVGVKSFLISPHDAHSDRKLEPEVEAVRNELVTETLTGAGAGAVLGGAAAGLLGSGGAAMIVAAPAIAMWS